MTSQELKNSILQLAVQGKLVPQDKNDEPASKLLKRIQAEKAQLIKEGKIKKEKALSPIVEEELPFDIPESWEWIRLGDVGSWGSGATPSKSNSAYYNNATIPWLVTGDLNDSVITEIPGKITEKALNETSVKLNPADSVLMAMYGATIGKVGLLTFPATTNQACCACQAFSGINLWYLMYFLMSQRKAFVKRGEGGAQPNISKEKIVVTLMPLPPLAEQQRIVDKIEELLPLVEEYRKAETRLKELNVDFRDMLRKSILQQAVQGKLTERNPEDEPASELLKRFQAEKTKLIKESKVKKDKSLSSITEDEIPFDIPDTWQWVRLNVCTPVLNGDRGKNYPSKSTLSKEGIPFISALNLNGKTVIEDDNLLCLSQMQYDKLRNGKLNKNDIVVCIRGSLGKHGQYPFEKGAIASSLVILRPYFNPSTFAKYLMLYLDSPLFFNEIKKYDNGTAQPNLAAKSLEQFLFPLPPLEEQKRIVDRVEELLSLCDQLK